MLKEYIYILLLYDTGCITVERAYLKLGILGTERISEDFWTTVNEVEGLNVLEVRVIGGGFKVFLALCIAR